jgi:hypothetical protein
MFRSIWSSSGVRFEVSSVTIAAVLHSMWFHPYELVYPIVMGRSSCCVVLVLVATRICRLVQEYLNSWGGRDDRHLRGQDEITNGRMQCYLKRPPLWDSGQSSWLQIPRSAFDSRRYQIFWEVVGLERGPLSLVSTTEELLQRKSSGSGLESGEYGRRDPSGWPRGTLYPQKVALTSPNSGGRSVGIVRSRILATEFSFSSGI